jgi:Fe2+ or Zn2+ uptake regulation protein
MIKSNSKEEILKLLKRFDEPIKVSTLLFFCEKYTGEKYTFATINKNLDRLKTEEKVNFKIIRTGEKRIPVKFWYILKQNKK